MASLAVRRLMVDLEAPFERHWNAGDAFRSAFFNALSMSFPIGEQFFMDSLRHGAQALPAEQRAALEAQIQGFIGQEATHRRIHSLFNMQLARHGYTNAWANRIVKQVQYIEGHGDPRHGLAATAAAEHFTTILAQHLLQQPDVLAGAPPRLRAMWLWHAAEEIEHRSVAFDTYRALGGSEKWRRRWMRYVTFHFTTDVLRQTMRNLWHDGELLRWRTWRSAISFFFGKTGIMRRGVPVWRAYFRTDFHPSQHDETLALQWLREHANDYTVVGSARS